MPQVQTRRGAQRPGNAPQSQTPEAKTVAPLWTVRHVALACVSWRLFNVLTVRTFFSADEYWQSVEVAHRLVFGYGYLTWEWFAGIRGWTHPLLFGALYHLCATLGLDSPAALALLPRACQALFCAGGDVATYVLASRLFDDHAAKLALMCHLASWLVFFMGSRTFSTSMEAPLSAAALVLWPTWVGKARGRYWPALACAACACIIRPTAALYWLPLWLCELAVLDWGTRRHLYMSTAVVGAAALVLSTALDSYMYSRTVLVPWRFISFNVLKSGASLFGVHGALWYWYAGLPMVLATMTPFTFAGLATARHRAALPIAAASACFIGALSATPHKEFRFLLPLVSPACIFAGASLAQLGRISTKSAPRHVRVQEPRVPLRLACAVVVVPQLLGALYASLIHQSAPDVAMRHLAQAASSGRIGPGGILMLTPCHETPGYSHLHAPVPLIILDCSPQWRAQSEANERDAFFKDPMGHLERRFADLSASGTGLWNGSEPWSERVGNAVPPPVGLPSVVVAYDDIAAVIEDALVKRWGYTLEKRIFHAQFAVDRDQRALHIYYASRDE